MLRSLRDLHGLGVEVYFEQEDMSRTIKWGIKRGFEKGTSGCAEFVCFGYKRGDDGRLAIDEPDAKIVRKMFEMRAAESRPCLINGEIRRGERFFRRSRRFDAAILCVWQGNSTRSGGKRFAA